MKKSIELFSAKVGNNEEIINNLIQITGVDLPLAFKLFLNNFKVGVENMNNAKRMFEDIKLVITSIQFKTKLFTNVFRLAHFFSAEELKFNWSEGIKENQYMRYSILPIAFTECELLRIYISLDKSEFGTIWMDSPDKHDLYEAVKISKDIFEFISLLYETEILDEDFKGKEVYKNWGEDFWRVREK